MTPRRLIEPARLAGSTLLRSQTDARLVDLVRAGHSAAFDAIVQRYRRPLLAYCSRVLPDSRAEDAVQQTFLSAYQAMIRDGAELNLRPWLYRIARNASLNLLRQNGWSHDQLSDTLDGVDRPDQALERSEQLRSAVDAVKALPERQRGALVLRELEGRSYEEIAAELGVGDGAVRQLLHRARATLRTGASALTPVGLLERLVAASQGADPSGRIAELAAGVGGGVGVVKVGAALLATGAIATGTLATPIARHHHSRAPSSAHAAAVADHPGPASGSSVRVSHALAVPVALPQRGTAGHSGPGKHSSLQGGNSGPTGKHQSDDLHSQGRSGPSGDGSPGSGDDRHSGSQPPRSGSDDSHSGSGSPQSSPDDSGSGSPDHSASGDTAPSDTNPPQHDLTTTTPLTEDIAGTRHSADGSAPPSGD